MVVGAMAQDWRTPDAAAGFVEAAACRPPLAPVERVELRDERLVELVDEAMRLAQVPLISRRRVAFRCAISWTKIGVR